MDEHSGMYFGVRTWDSLPAMSVCCGLVFYLFYFRLETRFVISLNNVSFVLRGGCGCCQFPISVVCCQFVLTTSRFRDVCTVEKRRRNMYNSCSYFPAGALIFYIIIPQRLMKILNDDKCKYGPRACCLRCFISLMTS